MTRLSAVAASANCIVAREGEFESLGFVTHRRERMLVFVESQRFLVAALRNSGVSCILTDEATSADVPSTIGVLVSRTPRVSFYQLHNYLVRETDFYWSGFPSRIAPSAQIHSSAVIADQSVVIGERVRIGPHVCIMPRVRIADDAIVGPGCVVGSEGFQGFVHEGRTFPIEHGGSVRIDERAHLHANVCVDRALFGGVTTIGSDCAIDNLVYIAHDAVVGPSSRIAALSAISGSVELGRQVWVGPGATISSEIRVGDGAFVSLGSVVTKDVPAGTRVSGNFAIAHDRFLNHLREIR